MFSRCPEQFRVRYVLGVKEAPAVNMTLGTACHDTAEFNLRQKITSGEDLPIRTVVEYFHDQAVPGAIERDGGAGEINWKDTPGPDYVHERGGKMAEAFHEHAAPLIQPVAVETEYYVHVPGVAIPILGYVDWEEEGSVTDLKTSFPEAHVV